MRVQNRVVVVAATGYERGGRVRRRLGFSDGLMGQGMEFQLISLFFYLLLSREQICCPILFCKYFVITHSKGKDKQTKAQLEIQIVSFIFSIVFSYFYNKLSILLSRKNMLAPYYFKIICWYPEHT